MRRIQRLRKPSTAILTQYAAPSIPETAPVMGRIAAAPTTCLPSHSRNLSIGRRMAAAQTVVTDLVLPPQHSTTAIRADEITSSEDTDYTPAHSAKGLEVIGGLEGWFSKSSGNWGSSKKLVGFAPREKITNPAVLQLCAARAVLEAVAVAQTGKNAQDLLQRAWRDDGWEGLNQVVRLVWELDGDGNVVFEDGQTDLVKRLERNPSHRAGAIPATAAPELLNLLSPQWKSISLERADLKFAVSKRIYQLTGHLVPDSKLVKVRTAEHFMSLLMRPPPPVSVAHAIHQRGELQKLSNVRVYGKRVTPVHKAQQLGRWKVVETELARRDLPVLGHDDVDKIRENEWYRGPKPPPKDKKKRR